MKAAERKTAMSATTRPSRASRAKVAGKTGVPQQLDWECTRETSTPTKPPAIRPIRVQTLMFIWDSLSVEKNGDVDSAQIDSADGCEDIDARADQSSRR